MEPINSEGYINYYYYLNENYQEVMLPQNGWEIISDNRGYYPDNVSTVDFSQNNFLRIAPYMLFYNKYSGIARIFIRYGNNVVPNDAINAVEITISHQDNQKMSGLFRLGGSLDKPLDLVSTITKLTMKVPSPGASELWFSGDFQMAYDPCICNKESQITLDFNFLSSAQINLTGRAITVDDEIVNSNGAIDKTFLSNISNNDKSGFLIYENMQSLVDDYLNKLKKHKEKLEAINRYNQELDKYISTLEVAKLVLTGGALGVASTNPLSILTLLAQNPELGIWNPANTEDISKFWKLVDKTLLKGFDLMIKEDLKKKPIPQAPTMPTAAFSEMSFTGDIGTRTNVPSATINTPGSKNANIIVLTKPTQYPTYNEILGQFAILESPKLLISEIKNTNCTNYSSQEINIINNGQPQSYNLPLMQYEEVSNVQIKLAEDLKFKFNPVLQIEKYDIKVGFEVKRKVGYPIIEYPFPTSLYGIEFNNNVKHYNVANLNANFNSIDLNVNQNEEYKLDENIAFNSIMVPSDAVKSMYYSFGHKHVFKNPGINYNNQVLNSAQVDYLSNSLYGNCTQMQANFRYKEENQYFLKIAINITFPGLKSDGTPNEYTFFYTYEILNENITSQSTPLTSNIQGSLLDVNQYYEDLALNGVNFNGSPITGCTLSGNLYSCRAWNDITITGNNIVSSGYQVNVKAGNTISMNPECTVSPEIILSIEHVLNYNDPMPEMTETEVELFCLSTKYKADGVSKNNGFVDSDYSTESILEEKSKKPSEDIKYNLYPNPAEKFVLLKFNRLIDNIDITIFDLSGRNIKVDFDKVNDLYKIDLDKLTSGFYIVKIVTQYGVFSENLIVK